MAYQHLALTAGNAVISVPLPVFRFFWDYFQSRFRFTIRLDSPLPLPYGEAIATDHGHTHLNSEGVMLWL